MIDKGAIERYGSNFSCRAIVTKGVGTAVRSSNRRKDYIYYDFCVANNYPDADNPEFCQNRNDMIALRKPYYTQKCEVVDGDTNKSYYVTSLYIGDDKSGWHMTYIDQNTLVYGENELFVYSE